MEDPSAERVRVKDIFIQEEQPLKVPVKYSWSKQDSVNKELKIQPKAILRQHIVPSRILSQDSVTAANLDAYWLFSGHLSGLWPITTSGRYVYAIFSKYGDGINNYLKWRRPDSCSYLQEDYQKVAYEQPNGVDFLYTDSFDKKLVDLLANSGSMIIKSEFISPQQLYEISEHFSFIQIMQPVTDPNNYYIYCSNKNGEKMEKISFNDWWSVISNATITYDYDIDAHKCRIIWHIPC